MVRVGTLLLWMLLCTDRLILLTIFLFIYVIDKKDKEEAYPNRWVLEAS